MKKEKKVKKPKEPIIWKGVEYDSSFEVLFAQWLEEAVLHGYVAKYKYHPDPIILQASISRIYTIEGKKERLNRKESLFQKIVYTPDWIIIWTPKAYESGLVMSMDDLGRKMTNHPFVAQVTASGSIRSIIDVKPPTKQGGSNASYRDLSIKRPLIWTLKGYYVQPIVPVNAKKPEDCLFSKTWAPREYINRPRKDGKGNLMSYCLDKKVEDYERNVKT